MVQLAKRLLDGDNSIWSVISTWSFKQVHKNFVAQFPKPDWKTFAGFGRLFFSNVRWIFVTC